MQQKTFKKYQGILSSQYNRCKNVPINTLTNVAKEVFNTVSCLIVEEGQGEEGGGGRGGGAVKNVSEGELLGILLKICKMTLYYN